MRNVLPPEPEFRSCRFDPGESVRRPMTTVESDWSDASLRGADLSRADLRHARLQTTLLRGADLRGADTDGINWRGFDPAGARLDVVQAVAFARAHGALVE